MDLGDFLEGVPFIALKGFRGGYYMFEASESLINDYDDLMKQDDIYKSIVVGSLYYSDINSIVTKFGDITQTQDDQLNINTYVLGKLITIPIDQKMIDSFINGDIIDDHIIKN